MKKLHEKHLEILEKNNTMCSDTNCCMNKSTIFYAQKSSELTADIAIKFLNWCLMHDIDFIDNSDNGNIYIVEGVYLRGQFTTEQLFKEFIKSDYFK